MQAAAVTLGTEGAELIQRRGHELLPTEARLHAHDQDEVQVVEVGVDSLGRGARLDADAHLAAGGTDGGDGLGDSIGHSLQMEGDEVSARLGEIRRVLDRVADHQVDIVEHLRQGLVQALQHGGTKADVGHKVAVHHVKMQKVGTLV